MIPRIQKDPRLQEFGLTGYDSVSQLIVFLIICIFVKTSIVFWILFYIEVVNNHSKNSSIQIWNDSKSQDLFTQLSRADGVLFKIFRRNFLRNICHFFNNGNPLAPSEPPCNCFGHLQIALVTFSFDERLQIVCRYSPEVQL